MSLQIYADQLDCGVFNSSGLVDLSCLENLAKYLPCPTSHQEQPASRLPPKKTIFETPMLPRLPNLQSVGLAMPLAMRAMNNSTPQRAMNNSTPQRAMNNSTPQRAMTMIN
jgi:hypothetical protein